MSPSILTTASSPCRVHIHISIQGIRVNMHIHDSKFFRGPCARAMSLAFDRNQFTAQFPHHDLETFNDLFPASEVLNVFSVKGASCEVYMSQDVPLFFSFSKKKTAQLYPTVFALWKYPDLVPSLTVQKAVRHTHIHSEKLKHHTCTPAHNVTRQLRWSIVCLRESCAGLVGVTRSSLAAHYVVDR